MKLKEINYYEKYAKIRQNCWHIILLPAWLSIWGLVGAILYIFTPILMMLGFDFEFLQYILGVQEMVMAVWLIVKGYNKSAINSLMKEDMK